MYYNILWYTIRCCTTRWCTEGTHNNTLLGGCKGLFGDFSRFPFKTDKSEQILGQTEHYTVL